MTLLIVSPVVRHCPRCGGPALLSVQVSAGFEAVLCDACDIDHPTAGAVVMWFAVHGQLETPLDVEELASLVLPWIETVSPPSAGTISVEAVVAAWAESIYAAPGAAAGGASPGAGLMCDFCEAAVPRWAYRAAAAESVPAGDWYACDACRPYVDNREWSALAGAVGDDRSESWEAFAGAQQRAARPWPPQTRMYRWP
jgi:hypothetical protein